jgi:hypothetical protein
MRAVMSDAVGGYRESVADRVAATAQLPLALVDWSTEENKVDSGPHLTTTLNLYDMVQSTLGYSPPSPTDYAGQRDYIAGLIARLELDDSADFDERRIRRDIDRAEEQGLPFGLGHAATRTAANAFRTSLGPFVVRPLTELTPYRVLIEAFEAQDLLSGVHEQWLGLDPAGRTAYVEETGDDPAELAYEIYSVVKPSFRLAYQTVYQKAFIQCLVAIEPFSDALAQHWHNAASLTREELISGWIERFNRWLAPSLADDDAWAAAGIGPTGTISWTQASQRAIASYVAYALVAPLETWQVLSEPEALAAAKDWVATAWALAGVGRPPATVDGLLKQQAAPRRRTI